MGDGVAVNIKFLFALSALIYFTQGIGSLASQALYYYLRETLGLSVALIMSIGSISSIPWMIKPLYGYLSDHYKLFGTHRKHYIILSSIVSVVACLALGLTPFVSVALLIALLTVDAFGGAMKDVAVDGMMVEEGQKKKITGKIQSIQWTALGVAQVLTGVVGGYIAENASYRLAFLIIALFPLAIAIAASYYKEPKKFIKHRPIMSEIRILLSDKQFLLSAAFLFCLWFSPAVGTPIFNKMREELHLSKIWIGWLSTIGAVAGVIGSLLYFKLSTKIDLRKWLVYGTLLSAVSTFAYLYLTPASILCYNIVFGLSSAFVHLIMLDFMAKSCPKGQEATVFALLCSLVNFGTFCSNQAGALLFNFVGYNGLIIISGVFTLFCLGFIPKLRIR